MNKSGLRAVFVFLVRRDLGKPPPTHRYTPSRGWIIGGEKQRRAARFPLERPNHPNVTRAVLTSFPWPVCLRPASRFARSAHYPDLPVHELVVAEAQQLALGALA